MKTKTKTYKKCPTVKLDSYKITYQEINGNRYFSIYLEGSAVNLPPYVKVGQISYSLWQYYGSILFPQDFNRWYNDHKTALFLDRVEEYNKYLDEKCEPIIKKKLLKV